MKLSAPIRRMADIDVAPLDRIVARLRPLFDGAEAPVWSRVAERMRWIGMHERPADIGFRRMRPTAYAQLCVLNDELPHSPWALDIPAQIWPQDEQRSFAATVHEQLAGLYGEGELVFAVFAVLGPGGFIPRHRDMPHDTNKKAFSHHLHAPITEAEGCEFTFGNVSMMFERGGLYEVDNMRPHSAVYRGSGYRVNLLLDYCPVDNLDKRMLLM